MKLSLILMLVCTMQLSASVSLGQQVIVKSGEASLESILDDLNKQTGTIFMYNKENVDDCVSVELNMTSANLENVLDEICKQASFKYEIIDEFVVITKLAPVVETVVQQEKKSITGKVIDKDGVSLPGVSVVIKGTSVGTSTNMDGNYTLKVPGEGKVLIFSFVGMTSQEVAVASNVINVTMEADSEQMEEVVVTALGIRREVKALGYSVTEVKGDEIAKEATINPINALEGKVAGVEIDMGAGGTFGGSRIQIRGNSTLGSNNQPIFVIDGMILDNSTSGGSQWGSMDWGNELKNLNPDDFESISVLKGASATALYGSRAINGVILITTKKGDKRQGIGVEIRHTTAIDVAYKGYDFQNEFGQGYYKRMVDEEEWDGFKENADGSYSPQKFLSFGPKMNGQSIKLEDGSMGTFDAQPNNYLDTFEDALMNTTNVAINGGNKTTTFRLSFSHTDKEGLTPLNEFKKDGFTLRSTHKAHEYLNVDASITYVNSEGKNPPRHGSFGGHNIGRKFYYEFPRSYNTQWAQKNYKDENGIRNEDVTGSDLWFNLYENEMTRKEDSFRGMVKLISNITDNFNIVAEGNFNKYATFTEEMERSPKGNGDNAKYSLSKYSKDQKTFKVLANYSQQINDFDFGVSVGGETWKSVFNETASGTQGGFIEPGVFHLSNSRDKIRGSGRIGGEQKINSLYVFANVGWKNQLYVDFSLRNDWSSTLTYGDDTGNNSYYYPAVNTSWIFTDTFQDVIPSWFTFGKLRASWAQVGNDYDPYKLTTGYGRINRDFSDVNGNETIFYSHNSAKINNPDLQPELKTAIEFGTNLRFFDNRVNLDATWYKENTRDQILELPLPSSTGVGTQLINGGNIQNKGIEIELNVSPLRSSDWKWDMAFTYSNNENKIIDLIDGVEYRNLESGLDVTSRAVVGGDYGVLITKYGYKPYQHFDSEGNEVNHPMNGKNIVSTGGSFKRNGEEKEIGNIQADWRGGMSSYLKYKSFSLNIGLSAKFGGDMVYSGHQYGVQNGLLKSTLFGRTTEHGGITFEKDDKQYQDGIIPDGVFEFGTKIEGQDVSGMTYESAVSEGLVKPMHAYLYYYYKGSWGSGIREDAVLENSYVMLKDLTFSYHVPKKFSNLIGVNKAVLSVFAKNVGYLYTSLPDGINPIGNYNNKSGSAHEYGGTPFVRSYGVSVNVTL